MRRGRGKHWLLHWVLGGLPLLGLGCSQLPITALLSRTPTVVRAASPEPIQPIPVTWKPSPELHRMVYLQPASGPQGVTILRVSAAPPVTYLPPPQPESASAPAQLLPPQGAAPCENRGPSVVPVALETVFRLAEEQNPLIAQSREKVREACAEKRIAETRWLPDLYVGTAYYRHEGGIQDFTGPLIHSSTGAVFSGVEMNGQLDLREFAYQKVNSQRRVWQQRGELTRITTETLLEAATTYIDLLTARTGEAIARDMEADLKKQLEHVEKLAKTEPAANVEVARVKTELGGRQQALIKLREQSQGASAKLAYLLGIDPCAEMIPVDSQLVPIELVDATPATCDLVVQAMANGPGVQEMEGLLGLIHDSIERANGPGRLMPTIGLRMAEGAFGAGSGDNANWDNRWDLGLQARWNLTEFVTLRDRRRAAEAKVQQAHLAYQDLRNKLTAGVQEARTAILAGRDQIRLGREQIQSAREAHRLSDQRLKNNLPGATPSEVLLATRALALAQINYLTAVASYDKAQIRLMILLGIPAPSEDPLPGQ